MNAPQSTASITAVVFGSFDLEPIHADIIIKIMPIIGLNLAGVYSPLLAAG
jgi:hypothetical protein